VGTGRTTTSTYDAAGQLINISDPDATYAYNYDLDGRLLSVNNAGTTGSPGSPGVLMSYDYDAVGNVLSASDAINGTARGTTTYNYDPLDRLTSMRQSGTGVTDKRVDYAYNAVGQPTNVKRFSDLAGTQSVAETTHTFDRLNRLTTINHSRGGTPLSFYNYSYDANSRITGVTNRDGTSAYTYDDTDQLTGADYSFQPDEAYTYDANGNRTNAGYRTGLNNRLLSDGKFNYEYDGEGNVSRQTDILTGEVTQYTWDYRNRLTNVTRNGTPVGNYAYDVYDQRIGKVTPTGTERFVYGQNQNIALEFDGSGALTNRYLHGNSIDDVLADEANGSVGWALTDNLGSVRDVVDATGASQNHVVFDSFGNVTSETNPSFDTQFSFTGREFDAETGNYDYRNRPYRPISGRFMEVDLIGLNLGGDVNPYRYILNTPSNFIDPLGNKYRTLPNTPSRTLPNTPRKLPTIDPNRPTVPQNPINPNRAVPNDGLVDPTQWICLPFLPCIPVNSRPYQRAPLPQPAPTPQRIPKVRPNPAERNPNSCPLECAAESPPFLLGGSCNDVTASNTFSKGVAHHAPSWKAIEDSGIGLGKARGGYGAAPTVCMTLDDHEDTASFRGANRKYKPYQLKLLKSGDFIGAQNLDVVDIQRDFGHVYDVGLTQMLNYSIILQKRSPRLFK
jgi:RHS repeat-associated protein